MGKRTPWWIVKGLPNPNQLPDVKNKISEARKGHIPWNKWKKNVYSEETRTIMSEKAKERWRDIEYRERMCEAFKGRTPWNKGKKGVMPEPWNKGKKKIFSRETLERMSQKRKGRTPWNKGKHLTEKTKEKLSKALKGRSAWNKGKHWSIEIRRKIKAKAKEREKRYKKQGRHPNQGRHRSKEVREKIARKVGIISKKIWRDPRRRAEASMRGKILWSNPRYKKRVVQKIRKALWKKPTQPEQKVIEIIQLHGFPFHYVGDGEAIIGGLNPDFIHNNGEKKIIEVFGRVFHDPEITFKGKIPWHQQYFGRMACYAQFGYDCLILWDDELGDEVNIVEKIRGFIGE